MPAAARCWPGRWAAGLIGGNTGAGAYLVIARARYRLIRTHGWNDEAIGELQRRLGSARRGGR